MPGRDKSEIIRALSASMSAPAIKTAFFCASWTVELPTLYFHTENSVFGSRLLMFPGEE